MNSEPQPRPPRDGSSSARRRGLVTALVVSMIASWLLSMQTLPISLLAGVTALVSLVLLILLVVHAVRERRYGLAVLGAALGIPATLLIILGTGMSIAFYGPMAQYEQCRQTAITEQARAQCDAEVQGSMAQWVSTLLGG